jgi:hypothetical protein
VKEAILSLLLVGGLGVQEPAPVQPVVTFDDLVTAAEADAKALPPDLSRGVRYLDARSIPARLRKEVFGVFSHHANSLSREVKIVKPRDVTPWLWAVRLDDYRWDAKTWEELASVNFYYLVKAKTIVPGEVVKKTKQVLKTDKYNRQYYADEEYTEAGADVEKEDFIPAPWLPRTKTASLILMTGSRTPIVRVDQFINQTAIQSDRGKHGYYDWLAIKDRKDAEKLAALDRKAAEDLYREVAAIVPVSGVAPNNRQVFRYATITGSWWETRDAKNSREKRNAVSNLLDDYQHDAEEIVYTLPNGLAGYFLGDNKGVRQDTAPDFIASDGRSTNQDRRVHVGYSCIACHTDGGLKPIADYSRREGEATRIRVPGAARQVLQEGHVRVRGSHQGRLGDDRCRACQSL